MKNVDGRSWFATHGHTHKQDDEPAPRRPDPADMGTAFGLDASLMPTLPMPLDFEPSTLDEPPAGRD